MTNLQEHAEQVRDRLDDHVDLSIEEVHNRLQTLTDEYKVPIEEARRSLIARYVEEAGIDRAELDEQDSVVDIGSIDSAEEWITVEAKVIDLWEPQSDAIGQVGLLGDETGTVKFTKWSKSDLPTLDEDQVYRLSNVVTDEYQGQYSVKLNRTTTIETLDKDITVGDGTQEIEGALVDIQSGSGLIKRCPKDDCTRVLQNGRCSEHGDVDGEFDLRVKAVIDDGSTAHEVILDKETTEEITGITLEEAKDMAMDALDTTVVVEEISQKILGRYYRVSGPVIGRYLLADNLEALGKPETTEDLLIKARSI
ncbi:replication factor A [Salinarchaeum sp. IM2453]|uniref:replication factor A n=1 Tax=Salinarchaeum sp. IM2453 TaxID=2862870 RepID=UPI001C82A388|nr:replication factor A [Salinarchaeum sp. IM2453]QZA89483.1 replication factor A [Salinarchaeum sp. IM2453]